MNETSFEFARLLGGDLSIRWIVTMAHFLWQGAVVGGVAVTAASLLRGASASARYWLYATSLLCLPICAWVTFVSVETPSSWPARPAATDAVANGSAELAVSPSNNPSLARPPGYGADIGCARWPGASPMQACWTRLPGRPARSGCGLLPWSPFANGWRHPRSSGFCVPSCCCRRPS